MPQSSYWMRWTSSRTKCSAWVPRREQRVRMSSRDSDASTTTAWAMRPTVWARRTADRSAPQQIFRRSIRGTSPTPWTRPESRSIRGLVARLIITSHTSTFNRGEIRVNHLPDPSQRGPRGQLQPAHLLCNPFMKVIPPRPRRPMATNLYDAWQKMAQKSLSWRGSLGSGFVINFAASPVFRSERRPGVDEMRRAVVYLEV